jgi:indole-3-glycerol phosphate synthase
MADRPTLIAEVKTASPFGWRATRSWEELFELADRHGDMISIHTDPRWGGSFELIARARKLTSKPILAKGIHATDEDVRRALGEGASHVLVVGREPGVHREACLVEPHTLAELAGLSSDLRAVWNSRDLATGEKKTIAFGVARTVRRGWLCQASNIREPADVHPGADAILVGSHLPEYISKAS